MFKNIQKLYKDNAYKFITSLLKSNNVCREYLDYVNNKFSVRFQSR